MITQVDQGPKRVGDPVHGTARIDTRVAPRDYFIMGESLVQSFDLRPAESGGAAGGTFESYLDDVASGFSFVIDRIRATPRVCSA